LLLISDRFFHSLVDACNNKVVVELISYLVIFFVFSPPHYFQKSIIMLLQKRPSIGEGYAKKIIWCLTFFEHEQHVAIFESADQGINFLKPFGFDLKQCKFNSSADEEGYYYVKMSIEDATKSGLFSMFYTQANIKEITLILEEVEMNKQLIFCHDEYRGG
jgi:hypothetical protein